MTVAWFEDAARFGDALGGPDGTAPPRHRDASADPLALAPSADGAASTETWEPFRLPPLPAVPGGDHRAARALVQADALPPRPAPVPVERSGHVPPPPAVWTPAPARPPVQPSPIGRPARTVNLTGLLLFALFVLVVVVSLLT